MKLASILLAVGAMVFAVATPASAQFVETFEGLNNGDPVSNLPNWTGNSVADQYAELGGNRGISGTGTSTDFDLVGSGNLPELSDPFYEISFDGYFFSAFNNQFAQGRSPSARLFEIQYAGGNAWNYRTFNTGGGMTFTSGNIADLGPPVTGLRSMVVRIDPTAGTAQGIIRQQGQADLDLGTGPYPFASMDRIRMEFLGTKPWQLDTLSVIVPEPSTALLAGTGLLGLALFGRRRGVTTIGPGLYAKA